MSKTSAQPPATSAFVTTDTGEILDALDGLVKYAHRLAKSTASRPSLMVLGEGEIDFVVPPKTYKARSGEDVVVRYFGLRLEVHQKDGNRVVCPVKCSAWGAPLVEATMDRKGAIASRCLASSAWHRAKAASSHRSRSANCGSSSDRRRRRLLAHHDEVVCTGLDDECCARAYGELREAEPALVEKIGKALGRDPWKRVPAGRRALLFMLASRATPLNRARALEAAEGWCDEQIEQIWDAGLRCLRDGHAAKGN